MAKVSICIVALGFVALSTGLALDSAKDDRVDDLTVKKPRFRYLIIPSLNPVSQGQELCNDIGGTLAAVSTLDEDTNMIRQVGAQISNIGAWTSGRRDSKNEPWIWTATNEQVPTYNDDPDHFHHWINRANATDGFGCIYYGPALIQGLVWQAGNCNERKLSICQIPDGDDCEN